jgi:hypothetical protein
VKVEIEEPEVEAEPAIKIVADEVKEVEEVEKDQVVKKE